MAKQRDEHNVPTPGDDDADGTSKPIQDSEGVMDADPVTPDRKKTQLGKKSTKPTVLGKAAKLEDDDEEGPPTMLSKNEPVEEYVEPTPAPAAVIPPAKKSQLGKKITRPYAEPTPAPKHSIHDDDEALFVEAADDTPPAGHEPGSHVLSDESVSSGGTGVVNAKRVSDSSVLGSDVVEVQPLSAVVGAEGSSVVVAEFASDVTPHDADVMAGEFPLPAQIAAPSSHGASDFLHHGAENTSEARVNDMLDSIADAAPPSVLKAHSGEDIGELYTEADLFVDDADDDVQALSDHADEEPEAIEDDDAAAALLASDSSVEAAEVVEDADEIIEDAEELLEEAGEADEVTEPVDLDTIGEDHTTVNWDVGDGPKGSSSVHDQTIAFDSAVHDKGMEDLFTVEDTDESSAVDLGRHAGRKGSSKSGIDPVAEALESGMNLDDMDELEDRSRAAGRSAKEASVEFDELLTEERDEGSISRASSLEKTERSDDEGSLDWNAIAEAEANLSGTDEGDMMSQVDDEPSEELEELEELEEATDADAVEDETPKKKKKGKGKTEPVAFDEDEDEEPKKGKKGAKAKATPVVVKKSGGGVLAWMGGMVLGALFAAGGAGGVWYTQHDIVKQVYESQPDYKKPIPPPPVTPLHRAGEAIASSNYDDALRELKDGQDTDAIHHARANATWLKYLKEKKEKNAPINKDDEEVKEALKEAAKNTALLESMNRALNEVKLQADLKILSETENVFKEVRDVLEKSKIIEDTTDKAELPKAVEAILKQKDDSDKKVDGIGQALADAKFLEDKTKLEVPVFEKILKDLGDKKITLDSVNKLLKDAEVKDSGDKGVKEVIEARVDAETKVAEVNKVLEDEKIKDAGAKGVKELAENRTKMQKERDDFEGTIKTVVDELADAKVITPGGDPRKLVVEGTKLIRRKAESPLGIPLTQLGSTLNGVGVGAGGAVERAFDVGRVFAEVGFFHMREPFIQTPQQKLANHMTLLQDRNRKNTKELEAIQRETDWLISEEAGTNAEEKAKAHLVAGLALRNLERFDAARQEMQTALDLATKLKNGETLKTLASRAKLELTDPHAYYLPAAQQLQLAGNYEKALAELAVGLKAMPNKGRLLTQRAEVRLTMARAMAKIGDDDQKEIRADLDIASKDENAAAEAASVLGQLEEALNNFELAEKYYRLALKTAEASEANEADVNRYRLILGRLLQRDRAAGAEPAAPAEKKNDDKEKANEDKTSQQNLTPVHPLAQLLVAAAIGMQDVEEVDDPATNARTKESLDIAEKLIQSTDPKTKGQGRLLKGLALSKQGKRTEGLREYTAGMELIHPGIEAKDLTKLVDEHPAFQQPDLVKEKNPILAERHFAQGLHEYWSKNFAAAEKQFHESIKYFDQDARYYYFVGLAQLQQKTHVKRDAAFYSFELGARLETKGHPSVAEINASLERVQGQARQLIGNFRFKAGINAASK